MWASVCASPDLTHFPAPAAWGRGLRPHLEPPRLGATTATATVYDLPAISRRLPQRRADGVGTVQLDGLRLDAWPRCATALRSAAERPPTPPPCSRKVAARLWLARTAAPCRQPTADSKVPGGRWPPAGLSPSPDSRTALPVPSLFLRACLNPTPSDQTLAGTSCAPAPGSFGLRLWQRLRLQAVLGQPFSQATNSGKDGGSNANGPHATTPDNA